MKQQQELTVVTKTYDLILWTCGYGRPVDDHLCLVNSATVSDSESGNLRRKDLSNNSRHKACIMIVLDGRYARLIPTRMRQSVVSTSSITVPEESLK